MPFKIVLNRSVGMKCLTEAKRQILYDHVDHTRLHIVEMRCQMVQLLSGYIIGPTMFVIFPPALVRAKDIRINKGNTTTVHSLTLAAVVAFLLADNILAQSISLFSLL